MNASPQVIVALTEIITGGSANSQAPPIGIYRSGPEIVEFFMRNGFHDEYLSWSRVGHTREKLIEISQLPNGSSEILKLVADAVNPRDYIGKDENLAAAVDHLQQYLKLDGLVLAREGNRFVVREIGQMIPATAHNQEAADALGLDALKVEFERAQATLESDPAAALTAASSILEGVCKELIRRRGGEIPADQSADKLGRAVMKTLTILPEQYDDQDVKRLLGGLINIVAAAGALRTKFGSAHGRTNDDFVADKALAHLAVNAAMTTVYFLLERYQQVEDDSLGALLPTPTPPVL